MGGILKTAFKSSFTYGFALVAYQIEGMLQPFFEQPFSGSAMKNLFKIPFESG